MCGARINSRRLLCRPVLQQQSGIPASCTEVVDEDTARHTRFLQKRSLVESNMDIAIGEVFGKAFVDGILDANMRRYSVLLEHHQRLYQRSHAGGSFTMPDICLDSTKVEWLL